MHHTVSCHSDDPAATIDNAELMVDVDCGRAEVTLRGVAGSRAVSALRAMLDGLDGVHSPIRLVDALEPGSDPGIADVVIEARTSRRRRGLSEIRVE